MLVYFRYLSNLKFCQFSVGLQGQEWAKMDSTLVLSISLDTRVSHRSGGRPKFGDVSEIDDLRQGQAEDFMEN